MVHLVVPVVILDMCSQTVAQNQTGAFGKLCLESQLTALWLIKELRSWNYLSTNSLSSCSPIYNPFLEIYWPVTKHWIERQRLTCMEEKLEIERFQSWKVRQSKFAQKHLPLGCISLHSTELRYFQKSGEVLNLEKLELMDNELHYRVLWRLDCKGIKLCIKLSMILEIGTAELRMKVLSSQYISAVKWLLPHGCFWFLYMGKISSMNPSSLIVTPAKKEGKDRGRRAHLIGCTLVGSHYFTAEHGKMLWKSSSYTSTVI